MIREQIPNLLRPYVNPHVAQACYCLTHLVADAWPTLVAPDEFQVFLANSGEEALSGAVKLARYVANAEGLPATGLILDESGRFNHFAYIDLHGHGQLYFIPGLKVVSDQNAAAESLADPNSPVGFVVVSQASLLSAGMPVAAQSGAGPAAKTPLLIVATDRQSIGRALPGAVVAGERSPLHSDTPQRARPGLAAPRAPDIVVFDESFVNHDVPFGAFAATNRLFRRWNRRGMTTFHSTTYQPNTISTLHLVSCLREAAPEFMARHHVALERIDNDPQFRFQTFRDLYSRSLAKVAAAVGAKIGDVRASGHYFSIGGRRIFDGVAGVACSVRGHNPPSYVAELQKTGELESCRDELAERLTELTGLEHMVPAVSGASAVEHALKLALSAQVPRDWVLALRGGFGGKTLFALTGTWKSSLKAGLAPLYPNVVYVDPFCADATGQVEAAFREHPVGVVQVELIQGVGGVRAIPSAVLQCLAEMRARTDCLLLVDEVQTGMFRTGPFVRSKDVGIQPDLLTIGKSTSDMMFPFAMMLYSDFIHRRLDERDCRLPQDIRARYDYETGVRSVLNTLRRADRDRFVGQVREKSELFRRLLAEGLRDCRLVRDVRCFGLLIGIELDAERRPHRWLKKLIGQLYLLSMLNDARFPLLVGFCQYEPNVLKLTPPLAVTEEEVRSICATICSSLSRPLAGVALAGLRQMGFPARSRFQTSSSRSQALPRLGSANSEPLVHGN
jgi:acetylornithine/succinyldiaminopimelate/putrescine aminotransferase